LATGAAPACPRHACSGEKKPAWRGLSKCIVLLRHCGDEASRKLLFLEHLVSDVSFRQHVLWIDNI
jgi:hypothetical protein